MTADVDFARILKIKADFDSATPDHPTTIRDSTLSRLQYTNPDRYAEALAKIKTGACIVVNTA